MDLKRAIEEHEALHDLNDALLRCRRAMVSRTCIISLVNVYFPIFDFVHDVLVSDLATAAEENEIAKITEKDKWT